MTVTRISQDLYNIEIPDDCIPDPIGDFAAEVIENNLSNALFSYNLRRVFKPTSWVADAMMVITSKLVQQVFSSVFSQCRIEDKRVLGMAAEFKGSVAWVILTKAKFPAIFSPTISFIRAEGDQISSLFTKKCSRFKLAQAALRILPRLYDGTSLSDWIIALVSQLETLSSTHSES